MSKGFALTAALLLLAGCNATDPTAPSPAYLHGETGCSVAIPSTAGTPAQAVVTAACQLGE